MQIKYYCRYCNARVTASNGKPTPGLCHARPKVNGRSQPHVWLKV